MAARRYKVLKQLPWIEGGHPVPGLQWEGGRYVVYEPGKFVVVDDQEVEGVFHCLEATDDAGKELLEEARTKAKSPAQRVAVADLHPRTKEWISRSVDERLRCKEEARQFCMRILARGDDPSHEDLAAAIQEAPEKPLPPELAEYISGIRNGQIKRKAGRKGSPRTTAEDLSISQAYCKSSPWTVSPNCWI